MYFIRLLHQSQFARQNAVFFLGSVAVGFLNYLYYPVLGRSLSPESFGEVQTLISLFLQLSIFLVVLSMVTVSIVANNEDTIVRNRLVYEFEKVALLVSVALLVASILLRNQLQSFLQFTSPWPFMLLALAIVATVPFTLRGAYLRGLQQFGKVSLGNIIGAAGKLLFAVLFVALGLGTNGAIGGLVAAQFVACAVIAWWARRACLHSNTMPKRFRLPNVRMLTKELSFGGIVLITSLAITLLYSIDILVIKHYFDARTAGIYAGVSAVARILFFLTASIAQVLISSVKIKETAAHNASVLKKSVALLCGLSAPPLILLVFFPKQITTLLMGANYAVFAALLPQLSIAVCIVALVNLYATYHLALHRKSVAIPIAAGLLLTSFLISIYHDTPAAVVRDLLGGSIATIASLGLWTITRKKGE